MPLTRADCLIRDEQDPLRALRDQFLLPPGVIYLDGNSLGVMPRETPDRVQQVVGQEWAKGLIRSWNDAGWIGMPQRVGDKLARLVGAGAGELVVADSTSVNLYKVLSAALSIATPASSSRNLILSERHNFPTDLYIAEGLARQNGCELVLAETPDEILQVLGQGKVSVLMLTHVNYRSGYMHDMAAMSRAAHRAGALVIWDLAHSAGAVPVDLKAGGERAAAADFAVGCGYKYLNGGPGAPAFVWVHPDHVNRFRQPLSGWMGHDAPFAFVPDYVPALGISQFLCGTPAIIAMAALECGIDTVLAADTLPGQGMAGHGMTGVRRKSLALTGLFIALAEARCSGHGLALASPREDEQRGSQVSLSHPSDGYPIMQALIARGVIGDFRAPDILRFGFTPLYTRYVDVWDAVEQLRQVLETGEWREARFHRRAGVT